MKKLPYQYIAIEGNIGAGKTTLCHMLKDQVEAKLVLEEFDDNPFLPLFYKDPERYAFQVELFFMAERHKQLHGNLSQPSLFERTTISDYFFIKTLLFAKNNLKDAEYELFKRIFNGLNGSFRRPDLLVYLHRPVEQLLKNIKKRGRSYESDISSEYLESVQKSYFDFFRTVHNIPVLIIDLEGVNFSSKKKHFKQIFKLINSEDYTLGVHRVKLGKQSLNMKI